MQSSPFPMRFLTTLVLTVGSSARFVNPMLSVLSLLNSRTLSQLSSFVTGSWMMQLEKAIGTAQ